MNYLYLNVLIEREDKQEITTEEGIDFIEKLDDLLEKYGYAMSGARVSLVSEKPQEDLQEVGGDISDEENEELDSMLVSSISRPNKNTKYN